MLPAGASQMARVRVVRREDMRDGLVMAKNADDYTDTSVWEVGVVPAGGGPAEQPDYEEFPEGMGIGREGSR
jgi:hypothetical protein